jgi:hypothetical protein
MAIKQANGTIIINHSTPVTVTPQSRDDGKGIEVYEFDDSTLSAGHLFIKRDLGRTLSSDGLAVQKGKVSVMLEKVTTAGKRRTLSVSANLSASSDFTSAEAEQTINDLGQFLLDYSVDLAAGRFSS